MQAVAVSRLPISLPANGFSLWLNPEAWPKPKLKLPAAATTLWLNPQTWPKSMIKLPGNPTTLWLNPSTWPVARPKPAAPATSTFSKAPLRLPGRQFTLWTQTTGTKPTLGGRPAPFKLPGRQFSIWTRPELAGLTAKGPQKSPAAKVAAPAGEPSAAASGSGVSKLGLVAGAVILAGVVAKWRMDVADSRKELRAANEQKVAAVQAKHEAVEAKKKASESITVKNAALTELETKALSVSKERDGAKQSLAQTEEKLKLAETAAKEASGKLESTAKALTDLQKDVGVKEAAMNNSVAALKEEATKLKRSLEQKELEARDALAKIESEKAAAIKDASTAAAQVRDLTSQREKLQAELNAVKKELEAAKTKPTTPPAQ